jgi:CBS domain containing-hemolysin-like protein
MPADVPARPSEGEGSRRRRLGGFLIRLGERLGGDTTDRAAESADQDDPAADIVDQAEAFQTVRVSDVMTPRADIIALELSTPFGEVARQFAEAQHSRMPIYRETLDEPIGLANVKDVFKLLQPQKAGAQAAAIKEPVLRRLRREVLYVPPSMRAADLLVKMQATRIHMALVIDEFGGTDGLVTLEDLVEAVVGEIEDEYDEAEPQMIARSGGVWEADGRAPLEELEAALELKLDPPDFEEEIETVAGLVTAIAGRLPQRGEVIAHPAGFDFEITDADPRRVKRVRVRPAPRPAAEEAPPAPRAAGA